MNGGCKMKKKSLLGGGILCIMLLLHSFVWADTEDSVSINSTYIEKQQYIESLQSEEIAINTNAVTLADVTQKSSIDDITIDSSDVVFGFAQLRNMIDGAGALDSTTGNGYDSSVNNNVVRTHDSITYQLGYGLQLSNSLNENVYKNGKLYVKFTLPVTEDKAQFDEKSIECITNKNKQVVNGQQILTGEYILPKNEQGFSIPCAGRIDITINVKDMTNNSYIQPRFELSSKSNVYEKTIIPPSCQVTCRGAYNISTNGNVGNSTSGTYVDYTGASHRSSYANAVDISITPMYDEDEDGNKVRKKGVYFPKNARFTVDYWAREDNANVPVSVWLSDFGYNPNQGTYTSDFSKYNQRLEFPKDKQPASGSISITNHSKFTITLNGMPESGGACRVILLAEYPNIDATVTKHLRYSNRLYEDNGWKSIVEGEAEEYTTSWHQTGSGAWVDYFAVTKNCDKADADRPMHMWYGNGHGKRQLHSNFEAGDTRLSKGDEVTLVHETDISGLTSSGIPSKSVNMYTFFDANCFEPLEVSSEGVRPHVSSSNYDSFFNYSSCKILWLAKRTGGNWTSQADMASVDYNNVGSKLRAYTSLSALKSSGATCVGVVCEFRGFAPKHEVSSAVLVDLPVRIKSTVTERSTYMFSGGSIFWHEDGISSHTNNWFTTPGNPYTWDLQHSARYRKTEFSPTGVVIRSHDDPRNGQTVFINPIRATVDIDIAQTDGGTTKSTYRYSEGDKYVWLKVTPGYKGVLSGSQTWTYTVTLPTGLKLPKNPMIAGYDWGLVYDGGTFSNASIYGENGSVTGGVKLTPNIISQASPGDTVFTFRKTFSSASDFKPFYIKTEIDGLYVVNGRNYTINCKVTGDGALIVNNIYNNSDDTGMNVILKHSVTIAKTGLSSIEYGDNLEYSLHITNQGTTVDNMVVKDLLPNSFSGTDSKARYKVAGLRLTKKQGSYDAGLSSSEHLTGIYRPVGNTSEDINTWNTFTFDLTTGNASLPSLTEVTAIGIKGTLNPGVSLTLNIDLALEDETMGDTFYNGFEFEGANFPETIKSNLVKTVIPIRTARLTIEKKLKANTYVSPKGEYIFHYKITSLDNDRNSPITFYKTIKISSGTSKSITFDLPARVYKVEELCPNDWSISNKQPSTNSFLLRPVSDWRTIGSSASVNFTGVEELYAKLNTGGKGKVTFTNQGSFRDYTHNNEIVNNLK